MSKTHKVLKDPHPLWPRFVQTYCSGVNGYYVKGEATTRSWKSVTCKNCLKSTEAPKNKKLEW